MARKYLVPVLALLLMVSCDFLRAEEIGPPAREFSIKPPRDWIELPLPLQGVVVSYGKRGTLATFHITERDLDQAGTVPIPIHSSKAEIGAVLTTVDQLKWADLFSPQFASINIHKEGMTVLAGEKTRFCIYSLKPGAFKTTMEGKLPGKYINYVLIRKGKLFSITFKDTEDGFTLNYPSFLAAVRTLQFDTPASPVLREKR